MYCQPKSSDIFERLSYPFSRSDIRRVYFHTLLSRVEACSTPPTKHEKQSARHTGQNSTRQVGFNIHYLHFYCFIYERVTHPYSILATTIASTTLTTTIKQYPRLSSQSTNTCIPFTFFCEEAEAHPRKRKKKHDYFNHVITHRRLHQKRRY